MPRKKPVQEAKPEEKEAEAVIQAVKLKKINVPLATAAFTRIWSTAVEMLLRQQKLLKREISYGGPVKAESEAKLRFLGQLARHFRYLGLPITKKEITSWNVSLELVERLEKQIEERGRKRMMLTTSEIQILIGALVLIHESKIWKQLDDYKLELVGDLNAMRIRQLAAYLDANCWSGYRETDPEIEARNRETSSWEYDGLVHMLTTGEYPEEDCKDDRELEESSEEETDERVQEPVPASADDF